MSSLFPVKVLYKVHMEKQIRKCDLQMDHIQLQIKKTLTLNKLKVVLIK